MKRMGIACLLLVCGLCSLMLCGCAKTFREQIDGDMGGVLKYTERSSLKYAYDEDGNGGKGTWWVERIRSAAAVQDRVLAEIDGKPVTRVGSRAFRDDTMIKTVVLPDSMIEIGAQAFFNCVALEKVTIEGNGLKEIGNRAFFNCLRLKEIEFGGTKAEWNAIQKGTDCFAYEGVLGDESTVRPCVLTVHCSDGDLTFGTEE